VKKGTNNEISFVQIILYIERPDYAADEQPGKIMALIQ